MIWVLFFILIIIASAVLAYRSMIDFQELPATSLAYGLFLIRHKRNFNLSTLEKLSSFALNSEAIISLERLFKGQESVLVLYGPSNIASSFPELELLELEDYLDPKQGSSLDQQDPNKVNINQALAWVIAPKNNPKKALKVEPQFLRLLELDPAQRFFWQIVLFPQDSNFQVTIRAMVTEKDPGKRVEIAKKVSTQITEDTGLIRQPKQESSGKIYQAIQKRTLVPKEVSQFILSGEEILSLTGV